MDEEILFDQINTYTFKKIPQIYKEVFQRNQMVTVFALNQKKTNHVDFWEL